MVVLVIMGCVAAGLSLGIGSLHGRDEARSLARLRHVLAAGGERAALRGQALAIDFQGDGYRFQAAGVDGQWQPLDEPPLFTGRPLPPGFAWGRLLIDGQPPANGQRRLVFGARPPEFELRVDTQQGSARLLGLASGEVMLDGPGAAR